MPDMISLVRSGQPIVNGSLVTFVQNAGAGVGTHASGVPTINKFIPSGTLNSVLDNRFLVGNYLTATSGV